MLWWLYPLGSCQNQSIKILSVLIYIQLAYVACNASPVTATLNKKIDYPKTPHKDKETKNGTAVPVVCLCLGGYTHLVHSKAHLLLLLLAKALLHAFHLLLIATGH